MVPDVGPHLPASEPALNHYSSIVFFLPVFLSLPKRNKQNSHVSTIYTANFIFIFNQLDTLLFNSYVYNHLFARVKFKMHLKLIENKN